MNIDVTSDDQIVIGRIVSYQKSELRSQYIEENGKEPSEAQLIDFAIENAECDLGCDWGHITNKKDLTLLDLTV